MVSEILFSWADGELEVEFWLSWDKGKPALETRVEAENLVVFATDGQWSVPLERAAFQAHVTENGDRWTLYTSDIELLSNETLLQLSRIQVDAWGKSVRMRARDLQLAPMAEFAASFDSAPETLVDLLGELDPRGTLSAVQLSFSSIDNPGGDWEATANFESLAVESYKGAPGSSSARGYARLGPGVANVIVDTRDFDLSFPKIYHQPLVFDQLYGSLDVNWDSDAVSLSSGILTAEGEEGVVHALFGLDIPLVPNDVGVEMELLVGLKDADVRYRSKYIPYTLSASLLDWLAQSIEVGEISEGAFLWRGALKSSLPSRRTVQLALNVHDTSLNYHADWPPVAVESAIVIIDDGRVKAEGSAGRLLDSRARDIRVETAPAPDAKIALTVLGVVEGQASDGLHLVNNSPLTPIIGNVFSRWTAEKGQLKTNLELNLLLGPDSPPPEVKVSTEWSDVDVSILPGNLLLKGVVGNFGYSSSEGFSSTGMQARLWGEELQLSVSQLHDSPEGYDSKNSTLVVSADGEVDMAEVQRWLSLQPLEMATGRTSVGIDVFINPGDSPLLVVKSDLQGVSLDLPKPWGKPEQTLSAMLLTMDLGDSTKPILLNIEDALKLSLELSDGGLYRAALGIGVLAPAASPSEFRVSGKASHVDGDEWLGFVSRYLSYGGFAQQDDDKASDEQVFATVPDPNSQLIAERPDQLRVVVDGLSADTVSFMGQSAADATLDLSVLGPDLEVSLDSDWLDGLIHWRLDGEESSIALEYLDLSHFDNEPVEGRSSEIAAAAGASVALESEERVEDIAGDSAPESLEQAVFELPDMRVSIANLYQGERRVGDASFQLTTNDGRLVAQRITGEFAAVRLIPEKPGRLVWQQGEGGYTEIVGTLAFNDIGSTLSYFGYQKIIQTRKGSIDVQLRWPESPASFSLADTRGSILLDVGSGSFLDAPGGAAGALRVVNILNLVHLVQRLSVSHMFDSGIPFDAVEGEIYLHHGTIEVPFMRVKGGSSFHFSGVSDVAEESLQGEMVATLPVAKNLPWVAALAASLPVAAGVYVVSKIFDKQVNRLSSAVYKIEGTWDEPKINFSRIFDDSSTALPARSANDTAEASSNNSAGLDPNAPMLEGVTEEAAQQVDGQEQEQLADPQVIPAGESGLQLEPANEGLVEPADPNQRQLPELHQDAAPQEAGPQVERGQPEAEQAVSGELQTRASKQGQELEALGFEDFDPNQPGLKKAVSHDTATNETVLEAPLTAQ
jgi:uncharacterized protein YhdP